MVMRQTDLQRNMAFGQPTMITSVPDDDMKRNIDGWLNAMPFAYRKRRVSFAQYGELSIRHSLSSGAETELAKILNGQAKAKLYIWEFPECWILVSASDLLHFLKSKQYTTQVNHDGITAALYIKAADIKHIEINK